MLADAQAMELSSSAFQTEDGIERLLKLIQTRLNITDFQLETESFSKLFDKLERRRGDTITKYINAEEAAYRKLQSVLKEALKEGADEYSDDDTEPSGKGSNKFKLPKTPSWLVLSSTSTHTT